MHTPYGTWLLIFNIIPVTMMWALFYDELRPYWRTFIYAIAMSEIVGIAWDSVAINAKLWYWPAECCVLPRVSNLPLEEPVFMAFTAALIIAMTILCRDVLATHRRHARAYAKRGRK